MDLDSLKSFIAIHETGSFTSAGNRVGRTQSAVSQQVKKLEARIGSPLFNRRSGAISLTEAGQRLLPYAREMLNLEERALAEFSLSEFGGRITLGVPELYAEFLLPLILPDFQKQYPNVEISLTHRESPVLLKMVQDGSLDLSLFTDLEGGRVGPDKLFSERVQWIGPVSSKLEDQDTIPVVVWREGTNYRRTILSSLESASIPYRIALTTQSVGGLLSAIAAGVGIGAVTPVNFSKKLRVIEPDAGLPVLPRLTLFLHRGNTKNSKVARALGDHIVTVGKSLAKKFHSPG